MNARRGSAAAITAVDLKVRAQGASNVTVKGTLGTQVVPAARAGVYLADGTFSSERAFLEDGSPPMYPEEIPSPSQSDGASDADGEWCLVPFHRLNPKMLDLRLTKKGRVAYLTTRTRTSTVRLCCLDPKLTRLCLGIRTSGKSKVTITGPTRSQQYTAPW